MKGAWLAAAVLLVAAGCSARGPKPRVGPAETRPTVRGTWLVQDARNAGQVRLTNCSGSLRRYEGLTATSWSACRLDPIPVEQHAEAFTFRDVPFRCESGARGLASGGGTLRGGRLEMQVDMAHEGEQETATVTGVLSGDSLSLSMVRLVDLDRDGRGACDLTPGLRLDATIRR